MEKYLSKIFTSFIVLLLVVQFSGCGTILYPERRGQRAGHLDVGVVLLDGVGLLFFLIPGIIAFAVDFSNGTIYLPGTVVIRSGHRQIKFDSKHTTTAQIEKIISDETGRSVKLSQSNIKISRLKSQAELAEHFASANQETNQLAMVR
jgi:hypothetical protein